MAGSLNKVMLIGNLGADPDMRQTQDGKKMALLSLATSESWKDRGTGEKKEKTDWHRIVIFNEGLAGIVENYLKKGSIIVDHTTTSSELSMEMNELLNSKDIFYIDAPVSGGEAGAQSGQLSIMAGGDKEAFNSIENILEPYTKFIKYMGPSGSGQLTKMVNQICIAGLIQALAEGVNFSKKVGLNTQDVFEVVSKGAAQSWQMENRWETMTQNKYDYGFAVDLMRKDLDIVLKEAYKSNISLDVTKIINEFYKDIQDARGGRWDTSSLLKRLEELT